MQKRIHVAVIASIIMVGAAHASDIYIVDNNARFDTITTGGVLTNIGSTLDASGAPIVLGDIGVNSSGEVYGFGWTKGSSADTNLYKVSTFDGSLTTIGDTGLTFAGGTFRSDGTLFGGATNGNFYSINTTTGAASLIGALGTFTDGDFTFDDTGTLYMTGGGGSLYTVDTSTGAASLVGPAAGGLFGLTFYRGTLYGWGFDSKVYSIDRSTGATTYLADYSNDGRFLGTYGADTAPGVPGPAAVIPMAFGLAATALKRRKRS
jgi:hypothetical protein